MNKIPSNAHLIIIGAMKCGTTSLYHYLESHPEICPAKTKEPEYFSDFRSDLPKTENYEDLFNYNPTIHKYVMEGSTGYTKFPNRKSRDVPKRIFEYGLRPKFIYMVRNPFERIISHYNSKPKWKKKIENGHLIGTTKYCQQLELYREYFAMNEDLLLLDFQEFKRSPQNVLREVYKFLKIEETVFPTEYENKNKTPSITGFGAFFERSFLSKVTNYLPRPINEFTQYCVRKFSKVKKDRLTLEEEKAVFDALKDDMFQFQSKYGFDVSKWGFYSPVETHENRDSMPESSVR